MREKRRAKRVKEKAEVSITLIHQDDLRAGSKIIHHFTKDISLGGIRIQSDTFIPVNSMVKIKLPIGSPTKLISALGKVRWIKRLEEGLFEMGVEFVDTSQESVRILKDFIEKSIIK
jgi:c-di-GMP-binding flagellar brake protein YcgR